MYVSDTGFLSGTANQPPNPLKPHTIYAFDIATRNGGQFLQNKRVFAVCDNGIPGLVSAAKARDTLGTAYPFRSRKLKILICRWSEA